jgi:hypothetical protein
MRLKATDFALSKKNSRFFTLDKIQAYSLGSGGLDDRDYVRQARDAPLS